MKKSLVPVIGLLLAVLGLAASSQSPPYRESVTEFAVELEPVSKELTRGSLVVLDDFEDPVLESEFGGAYRWGTSHDDPVSSCEITWSPDGPLGGYLAFEYVNRSWMKLALCDFPRPIDATEYEGIEVVLWSDSSLEVELEIGTGGVAYVSPPFAVSEIPLVYRIPFRDLVAYGSHEAGIPGPHLAEVRSISFFPSDSEGTLHVDSLALYGDGETAAPHSPENLVGRITRYASAETVPFSVRYGAQFPGHEDLRYYWTTDLHEELEEPDGLYVVSGIAAPADQGAEVAFVIHSNASPFGVKLVIEDDRGRQYEWQDVGADLPLHNETEITLDATVFLPDEDIANVLWTAQNGDPADAVTFPIADPTAPVTTLVSEWPNVLTVSCQITTVDGTTEEREIEALLYFRDGTPFEVRSVPSTIGCPISLDDRDEVLDQEFRFLRSLGANCITTALNWFFGPPDEDSDWTIHPIWESRDAWPHDPRGSTIHMDDFEALVTRAHAEGFRVFVEMRQWPYQNDPDIEWSRTTYESTFRTTDGFLYGDGQGYENMLLYYVDDFIRLDVDFVFLGAENSGVERNGGAKMRDFYESIIEQYAEAGFAGGISYASNYWGAFEYERELLIPGVSGIPYEGMDVVSSTYYPDLASRNGASTIEMQRWVREDIEEFFKPRTDIYNLPTIIEDCYCFAYTDCAVNPLEHGDKPREAECSRRYFNAILREFAAANLRTDTPWVQGMTIGEYKILADKYVRNFYQDGIVAYPWLNESAGRVELQLAIKVFYSDKPLLAEGE